MLSTRFTKHALVTEAHKTLQPYLSAHSITIDATTGNGHDTLFLARHSQKVYAFDIQKAAIDATRLRLQKSDYTHKVKLIHAGHESMLEHISENKKIDAIIFNLGYLPHSDQSIVTQKNSTLCALNHALSLLSPKGIISILAYPGHPGGTAEMHSVIHWYQQLDDSDFTITLIHSMQETMASPRLFIIQASVRQ